MALPEPIFEIRNLTVEYRTRGGNLRAVEDVNLDVYQGEILGLVGESGCGKSTLTFALLNMIEKPNRIVSGSIRYAGLGDVLKLSREQLQAYRWAEVSMIFQSAQNSLNPLLRIVEQAKLVMESHGRKVRDGEVRERVSDLARLVNLEPKRVLNAYPHELSGGMKQRVGIVMALLLNPKVLILDEPTTALDVISQARILENLKDVHKEFGTTMIFITHDMSVIAELADRMVVMYAGRIMETGMVDQVFYEAAHPYTRALMQAVPGLEGDPRDLRAIPGQPPDLRKLEPGCRFASRCTLVQDRCRLTEPALRTITPNHQSACLLTEANERTSEVAQ
ncbi:MAG: ABC transporter ATP-binding protein [Alicyclobacillus sp.]|nr:ABC transporter ATP-binding protein [Alicyclobacillus sp.]